MDEALRSDLIELHGVRALRESFRSWFLLSGFAGVERPVRVPRAA